VNRAEIYGGLTVDLNDGPIRTEYGRSTVDGKPLARLVIGEGSESLAIAVSKSNPETLAQLQEAVSELRAWVTLQERVKSLPEVA
jgi:ABC-type amino acid transport substrate-binding protein